MSIGVRKVVYVDSVGRKTLVLLPDDAPDSDAYMGLVIGPPNLDALGLPPKVQTHLHNELFNRELYAARDIRMKPRDVVGALMAALKVDAAAIVDVYLDNGASSG